jgi:hypothetical protein
MAEAAKATTTTEDTQELTDGFHLIIDALKLNGLTTIYGVPGIPITDFGRMAQAAGIRVLSFRRLPDEEARRLPHGVRAGLPQRTDGARARDDELLPDDPDLGLVRA